MKSNIYSSRQASAFGQDVLGGKAYNMAWLSRNGFPVPKWWVLTTTAFQAHLQSIELEAWIDDQVIDLKGDSNLQEVTKIAETIQDKIGQHELSSELKSEIETALPEEWLQDTFLAIRSSILGEDAEGASFAGQMDSYLYQKGLEAIFDSVVKVLQSAFNARALIYRLQKGLPVRDIQAAVIIQEMVDGDVSGVMFTAHPISGSRKHALISGTWGCGEGIVSGLCNTDEYTVHLDDNTVDTTINEKDVSLIFDTKSGLGTQEVEVEESRKMIACLSEAEIVKLKNIGKNIAEKYHFPQDIEWTLKDGEYYILQTRPVTSLPPPSDSTEKTVVWDNSNIQESYCGVTTPLTFSFANKAYATVYEQTCRLSGAKDDLINDNKDMLENMLGLINGRVYYNINNWYRGLLFLPSFGTNKADMERMMGLEDPVDMVKDTTLSLLEKLKKLPQMFRVLFVLLRNFRKMDLLVVEFRAFFKKAYDDVNRNQLHCKTIGELIGMSRELDSKLLDRWTTPIINDFYVMMMNGKVHRWLEKAKLENIDVLQNNLLSGEEGIESTEPTKMLLSMCDAIRSDASLKALIETTENSHLLEVLQVENEGFYRKCLTYIELYGDRTMGELKLESSTLRQDPAFMFAILKNFLTREDLTLDTLSSNEAKFRLDSEEEAFSAVRRLGGRSLVKFKKDLVKLRAAIKNRENMRLARTRMFGLYRDIYLEIGEQLTFYGLLNEPKDVMYLTVEELYAYNDGRSVQTSFRPLVAARQEEFLGYADKEPAHHFWTRGAVYHHNEYTYPHADNVNIELSATSLKGTGCYPGIVEKKIRLIFSPDDELSVDGQILCTVRTDPGWAPLFPTAGGIIVERGSTLSHSAVVARELGIPAIVGVPGLTTIVKDGENVRMDGSTGVIERLDVEDEEVTADEVIADESKDQ